LIFEDGRINETVDVQKIRDYVWYMETKLPAQPFNDANPYFLGETDGTAYYFYYERGDTTTLDKEFLAAISSVAERYIIYADQCILSKEKMLRYGITFKKIPRDISVL
jgi:adenine-specific DNA-methyltransferase